MGPGSWGGACWGERDPKVAGRRYRWGHFDKAAVLLLSSRDRGVVDVCGSLLDDHARVGGRQRWMLGCAQVIG